MAKLSAQLQERESLGRVTRTQRQLQESERTRKALEDKQRSEALKKEVEEIQRTKLSKAQTIEEFETEFNKLRPEIQQFFSSPDELRQQKTQRIEENTQEIQSRVEKTELELEQARAEFEASKKEIPDITPQDRTQFKKDITRGFNERKAFLFEKLSGLKEGLSRLEKGEELTVGSIESFAKRRGAVAEERERARSKQEPKMEKKVTSISASKFLEEKLRGLKKVGETKEVRDVEGGFSEVSIFEKGKEKVQIVRSKQTGKVFVTDIGGKDKGEFVEFRGISDRELELEQTRLQNEAIKDFEEARQSKPFFLDIEKIERDQLPRHETISDRPTEFTKIEVDSDQSQNIIGKAFGLIKKGLSKTGDIRIPILGIVGIGEIKVRDIKEPIEQKIEKKKQELILKELEEEGILGELKAQTQEEFQIRFEDRFFKELIRGEITFEEAEKEFGESKEAKIISKKFEKSVERRREELLGGKFTAEGFAIAGLSVADLGLKLIPETIGGLILETGAIVTGIKLAKFIPSTVSTIGTGVIGGLGALEAVSPIALPEEKASGVITAGISLTVLGIQGVRFLRRPTIKTVKISPKPILSPEQQSGFVRKTSSKLVTDITGKTTKLEKFKVDKATEQLISGRRTIVSTKFRDILKLDPVFKGVPFTTEGRVGFNKALKILQKRLGLTETQSRSILRFRQPKLVLSKFEAEVLIRSGELFEKPLINLKGTRDITQPIITLDKSLGIKTRGATQIREFISGRGAVVGTAPTGEQILRVTFDIEKAFVTPSGAVFQKLSQAGRTTKQIQQFTLISEEGEGILTVQRKLRGLTFEKDLVLDIFSERSIAKQIIPKGKFFTGEGETAVIRTEIIPKEIDLRKLTGISIEEVRIPAPVKEIKQLKTAGDYNKLVDTLRKVYGDQTGVITKEIISTPKLPSTSVSTKLIQKTTDLKTVLEPRVSAVKVKIKDLLNIGAKLDTTSNILSKVGLASVSASKLSAEIDIRSIERSALKPELNLKTILKTRTLEDQVARVSTKLLSAQPQALSQKQLLDLGDISISAPIIPQASPQIPAFKIPKFTIPTIPFELPTIKEEIKRRGRKGKTIQQLLILPDFTSRVLGLDPEVLTQRQAVRRLRKIMTGLEIRRGVDISKLPQ